MLLQWETQQPPLHLRMDLTPDSVQRPPERLPGDSPPSLYILRTKSRLIIPASQQIKINGILRSGIYWTDLAQDNNQRRAVVNTVINLCIP
jgi:hypothetical protein